MKKKKRQIHVRIDPEDHQSLQDETDNISEFIGNLVKAYYENKDKTVNKDEAHLIHQIQLNEEKLRLLDDQSLKLREEVTVLNMQLRNLQVDRKKEFIKEQKEAERHNNTVRASGIMEMIDF